MTEPARPYQLDVRVLPAFVVVERRDERYTAHRISTPRPTLSHVRAA